MKLTRKALPILLTLNKLNKFHNSLYCYPSQNKLLDLLSKFTSLKISLRQLNYDLQNLESHGLILRIRRHRRTKHHGIEFRSTLYKITIIGYNLLLRGNVIAYGTFKAIVNIIKQALAKQERPPIIETRKSGLEKLSDIMGRLDTAFL